MNLFKNSIFCLLFISIFSCNKENSKLEKNEDVSSQNYTVDGGTGGPSIHNDSIMVNLVRNWISISMRTTDEVTLNNIVADNIIDPWEEDLVATTMGFVSFGEYFDYLNNLKSDYQYLESTYGFLSMSGTDKQAILNSVAQNVSFTVLYDEGFISHNNNPPSTTDMTCAESYAFCAASVTAAAIAGHASCGSSWLLPPVAVLCHASVIVLQLVGNEECTSSYKTCRD